MALSGALASLSGGAEGCFVPPGGRRLSRSAASPNRHLTNAASDSWKGPADIGEADWVGIPLPILRRHQKPRKKQTQERDLSPPRQSANLVGCFSNTLRPQRATPREFSDSQVGLC